jgi:AcrR family transcriptional regulator
MRVDELARDVGISKRTLYEQFRTKEQMAQEALVRLASKLNDSVERVLGEDRDEAGKLREVVLQLSQTYAKARPPFFRDLATAPVLTELVEDSQQRCFVVVEELIRRGVANGRFRTGLDPRLVRRTLLAAVQSVIRPEILNQDRMSVEQAFDGIIDLVLHGMFGHTHSA